MKELKKKGKRLIDDWYKLISMQKCFTWLLLDEFLDDPSFNVQFSKLIQMCDKFLSIEELIFHISLPRLGYFQWKKET